VGHCHRQDRPIDVRSWATISFQQAIPSCPFKAREAFSKLKTGYPVLSFFNRLSRPVIFSIGYPALSFFQQAIPSCHSCHFIMDSTRPQPSETVRALLAAGTDYTNFTTTPTGQINQITDVPDTYQLHKLENPLSDPEQFDVWFDACTTILRQKGMHNLLDIKIPRPQTSDTDNAKKWVKSSRDVQSWLVINMTNEMYQLIKAQGFQIQFADEFIHNAKAVFQI
jgi:hypothetical protein